MKTIEELEQENAELRAAILDIDSHATPIGLLDPNDPEGSPLYYAVTTGSLHRALGKTGTAAKCDMATLFDDYLREMEEVVIPNIMAAMKMRAKAAQKARHWILD
jgi:hypothetical protein